MDHDEHHDHPTFSIGERISYLNKQGKVSRINIMGFKACCCIEIEWDDGSMKKVLQMHQLNDIVKL